MHFVFFSSMCCRVCVLIPRPRPDCSSPAPPPCQSSPPRSQPLVAVTRSSATPAAVPHGLYNQPCVLSWRALLPPAAEQPRSGSCSHHYRSLHPFLAIDYWLAPPATISSSLSHPNQPKSAFMIMLGEIFKFRINFYGDYEI
uniref:Uncharacterized protein n=1 Tax=Opuntia streptacantha TaxID=393608 RepID=A0A7C8YD29_OPUST